VNVVVVVVRRGWDVCEVVRLYGTHRTTYEPWWLQQTTKKSKTIVTKRIIYSWNNWLQILFCESETIVLWMPLHGSMIYVVGVYD
jgi:hypothetical protein